MSAAFALAFAIAIGAWAVIGAPRWVLGAGATVLVLGFFAAFTWSGASWKREERQRRRAGVHPSGQVEGRQRPAPRSMVGAVGGAGFLFSFAATFGLPLTIVGAVSHVSGLLIAGLVLLIAELVDLSIVWPARRARHSGRR
jgi:hypothetical protein